MKKSVILFVIVLLSFGCFLWAGTATATTISLGPEVPLAESGGILDRLYGLSNLLRIDDDLDKIWFPASGTAMAQAKYAGYSQNFGYIPQNSGIFDSDDFVSLFTVTSNGPLFGSPTASLSSGNVNFLWALNPSGAPLWTSLPTQNSDNSDHMVTWLITGSVGKSNTIGNYVIAWEDLYDGGDHDFNDLVVEASFNPAPVPEPTTLLLLGSGLVGIGAFRRKFKK